MLRHISFVSSYDPNVQHSWPAWESTNGSCEDDEYSSSTHYVVAATVMHFLSSPYDDPCNWKQACGHGRGREGRGVRGAPADKEWVRSFRRAAAAAAPPPLGLRRCCLCHETLSSPLRMAEHLRGARHCEAVLRRHRRRGGRCDGPQPGEAEAAMLFDELSTQRIVRVRPEPPNVALVGTPGSRCLERVAPIEEN